ncbi:PIN-like domain-containing protein [Streptomyces sp. NPDC004134]|uniref:PIN-like domain-containing protein n=1 Tax=Streptomyces sp. NPDC004134 TaxID=3364691 RepID=UPI0036C2D011
MLDQPALNTFPETPGDVKATLRYCFYAQGPMHRLKFGENLPEKSHDVAKGSKQSSPRGIFNCEDAYRTPTREDYSHLFTSGMIALDTNVLLNLYRSNEHTRRDTFSALRKLRERLWIPHQVLSEFWRNRDLPSVRGHHNSKAKETRAALDKANRSVSDALDRWLRDVHLANDANAKEHLARSKKAIERTLNEVKAYIQKQAEEDALKGDSTTQSDPVLTELDELLRGRIGEPYLKSALSAAILEAEKRAEKQVPPGYEDFKEKPVEKAAGDYLMWSQILEEAERRRSDVLLVTGDVKSDWWIPSTPYAPARPRTELTVELRNRADVQLFMVTPSQLLALANEVFNLRVDLRSVSDLERSEQARDRSRGYSDGVEIALRQLFPEAEVLNLDEQLTRGARVPMPDMALKLRGVNIGIEVRHYIKNLDADDLRHLKKIVEAHELQAILVISHSPLTATAVQYLMDLERESDVRTKWVRISKGYIEDGVARNMLTAAISELFDEAS